MPQNEESINAITVKVPPFTSKSPSMWFAILEAQFHLRKIVQEETKFYHCLSALTPQILERISPTIVANKNYDDLKEQLISQYERTKAELFDEIIKSQPLVGKPSMFLHDLMQNAAKIGVGNDLVRHKFIQALPATIAPAIASQSDSNLAQIGKLADELIPLAKQAPVMEVPATVNRNSFQASRSTSNYTLTPFHPSQKPKICRAHIFYADKARSCKVWCKWKNKSKDLNILPSSRSSSPATSRSSSPNPPTTHYKNPEN